MKHNRISLKSVVQSLRRRKIRVMLLLATMPVILLLKPMLILTANFLEIPSTDQASEVMIIEGGFGLSTYTMNEALAVYRRGLAEKIVIALHSYNRHPEIFGIEHYEKYVAAALDSLGIPNGSYRIMLIEVKEPFTYNTAKTLSDSLPNIQSLLVFSDNFHIRRSYLTFKKTFGARGVIVRPYTIPIYLNAHNWWTSVNGWRRIIDEYFKLGFYWFKGYI